MRSQYKHSQCMPNPSKCERRNWRRTRANRTSEVLELFQVDLPVLERELAFFCVRERDPLALALHYCQAPVHW